MMRIVSAPVGSVGFDMLSPLTKEEAQALSEFVLPGTRTRATFVTRYLENTTLAEIEYVLETGLGMMFVGESRPNGYIPSALTGSADGIREVARARALQIPVGMDLGCDLEGMGGTADDTDAYANAQCQVHLASGYVPICYEGFGIPLTGAQIYTLPYRGYWKSGSDVADVPNAGYFMIQVLPSIYLELPTGRIAVDLDFVQMDHKGRLPTMVLAA